MKPTLTDINYVSRLNFKLIDSNPGIWYSNNKPVRYTRNISDYAKTLFFQKYEEVLIEGTNRWAIRRKP